MKLDELKHLFQNTYSYYTKYRSISCWLTWIICVAAGYVFLGPLIITSAFKWAYHESKSNPVMAYLMDIEGEITRALILTFIPILLRMAIGFRLYPAMRNDIPALNEMLELLSIFTRGPGNLLLSVFFFLLGVGIYAFMLENVQSAILIFLPALITFGIPGLFLKRMNLKFMEDPSSEFLIKNALKISCVCLALATAIFVYALASPIFERIELINYLYAVAND